MSGEINTRVTTKETDDAPRRRKKRRTAVIMDEGVDDNSLELSADQLEERFKKEAAALHSGEKAVTQDDLNRLIQDRSALASSKDASSSAAPLGRSRIPSCSTPATPLPPPRRTVTSSKPSVSGSGTGANKGANSRQGYQYLGHRSWLSHSLEAPMLVKHRKQLAPSLHCK